MRSVFNFKEVTQKNVLINLISERIKKVILTTQRRVKISEVFDEFVKYFPLWSFLIKNSATRALTCCQALVSIGI